MRSLFICLLAGTFLLTTTNSLQAQTTCNCAETYKWVKETFEKNDAGFQYALEQKGKDLYAKHNTLIAAKVKTIKDKYKCAEVLNEWLKFFRKGHFGVRTLGEGDGPVQKVNAEKWPVLPVTEPELRSIADTEAAGLFTGIWKTGAYTIGIVKKGKGYKGVILESGNPSWKYQQVKMEMKDDNAGTYYMGDFSPVHFNKVEWLGKNVIRLAPAILLERVYPLYPQDENLQLYIKEMKADKPFIQELSDQTILLRIPSFSGTQKPFIDSVLREYSALIKSRKNLVIDIRNGTGGDDVSYYNIIPLLYTNPIRIVDMEYLSTPLNNKRMEAYLDIPNLSEKNRQEVHAILKLLKDNLGKFVQLEKGSLVAIQQLDSVLPNPAQVAIIANKNNGSTDEQFLLAAKQSKKVKIFGESTFGVLDISNMYFVKSPDKKFELGYCLSKSFRIPGMAIDGIGVQPDYFMDRSIPDEHWLKYVVSVLEDKTFVQ
jgi:hypothetical protein